MALHVVVLGACLAGAAAPNARAESWPPLFRTGEHYELGHVSGAGSFPSGHHVRIATGDFNGDGYPDLVAPHVGNGAYRVLRHTGTSGHTRLFEPLEPSVGAPGSAARGVAVADFNLDGKDDLVIGTDGGVGVSRSTGPSFTFLKQYAVDSFRAIHDAGDLNGDGLPDLVITKGDVFGLNYAVCVMYSVNPDSLAPPVAYTSFTFSEPAPTIVDIDGDGPDDIAYWRSSDTEARIEFLIGNGAGSFALSPSTVPSVRHDYAVADLNADAVPDVVGIDSISDNFLVSVRLGAGGGAFLPPVQYQTGLDIIPFTVRTGDMDQDGDVDLVAVTRHNVVGGGNTADLIESISVLRNNGNGTFAPFERYVGGSNFRAAILADMDMDGRPDVVAAPYGGENGTGRTVHTISVIRNDGAGGFLEGTTSTPALGYRAQVVADFNRDGMPDVAFADSAAIRIGYGNGTGSFTPAVVASLPPLNPSSPPHCIVAGDIDRDGWTDLVVTTSGFDFQAFRNNGVAGTFTATGYFNGKLFPRSLADMNKDGWPDLVYGDQLGLNLVIQLNVNGTFQPFSFSGTGGHIQSLVVADWNRDANPDVVVATDAAGASIQHFPGDGTGFLQFPTTIQTNRLYSDVCMGDFNRDGKPDLTGRENAPIPTPAVQRGVDVWLGNGNGTFGPPTSLLTLETTGKFVDSWDANRDGNPDLVAFGVAPQVNLPPLSSVDVFLGAGSGSFGLRTSYALGVYGNKEMNLHPIAAGDINRDGAKDILGAVREGFAGFTRLNTVMASPPSRGNTFQPSLFTQTWNNPMDCAVGDLDRDGKPDVVTVTNVQNPGVGVHLNTGNAVLGPKATLSQAYYASQVRLADLNRDGILDITALSSSFSTRIYTMLGVGNGTFGPRQDLLLAAGLDFEIGDMNRDGIPDAVIAFSNGASHGIQVLVGIGNGTFAAGSFVTVPSIVYDLDLADMNRDGVLDVVIASNVLRVVHGNGNGTLGSLITLTTPITSCQTLSVADFNRDGFPDIQAHEVNVLYVIWGAASSPYSTWATTIATFVPFDVEVAEAEGNGEPYLYMARNVDRLEIVKVAPDGALTFAGSYTVTVSPIGLALGDMDRDGIQDAVTVGQDGSFVSVTLHGTGTVTGAEPVTPATGPLATLSQNAPNPFNPRTEIRFTLREDDRVQLRVHDVHGRVVATLAEGRLPAGSHSVPWEGKTASGQTVASGVYFYRLTSAKGFESSRRMILLK